MALFLHKLYILLNFVSKFKGQPINCMNSQKTGSLCWAAFLEMGARLENSPNIPCNFVGKKNY